MKYDKYSARARMQARPWDVHPVWRGIGCVMMIIIPIMAYAGAVLLVEENIKQGWLPTPLIFSRTILLPLVGGVPHLYANLIVTLVLSLIGFGVLVTIYTIMYAMIGPPRYGPVDSPPLPRRPKRR